MNIQRLSIGLIYACTAFMCAAFAQTSGTLNGTVNGPDGKPVPSASVMISGASGLTQNTVTGQDGTFAIANLPPGEYRVDVQVAAYKALSQENVEVTSGTPVSLTLTLEQGSPAEKVEVQGQASRIQDQNAQISRAYTGRVLTDLPIQDLNDQQLVEMMPGITPPVPFT